MSRAASSPRQPDKPVHASTITSRPHRLPPRLHLHPVGEAVVQVLVILPADLAHDGVAPLRVARIRDVARVIGGITALLARAAALVKAGPIA
jgi:hypothetical protein